MSAGTVLCPASERDSAVQWHELSRFFGCIKADGAETATHPHSSAKVSCISSCCRGIDDLEPGMLVKCMYVPPCGSDGLHESFWGACLPLLLPGNYFELVLAWRWAAGHASLCRAKSCVCLLHHRASRCYIICMVSGHARGDKHILQEYNFIPLWSCLPKASAMFARGMTNRDQCGGPVASNALLLLPTSSTPVLTHLR